MHTIKAQMPAIRSKTTSLAIIGKTMKIIVLTESSNYVRGTAVMVMGELME